MAAPCRHVGHYIQRNGRFLRSNFEQLLGIRSFGLTPAVYQAAEVIQESAESVVIPRKKTWSKEAVLEALASTVSRDPTAYPYQFQDDSFLSPRTATEFKQFSLSQESGRSAAKYLVNNNPTFFSKHFAEPHIPCLMPETVSLQLEEVSEEALKERINLRKVTAAVDMYDQLLQAGTAVSMATAHDLLDLICLYCDRDPAQDGVLQEEDANEAVKDERKRRATRSKATSWKPNSNAERIFNLLPERDTRCYSALIRGMVKHRAYEKAFSLYTDLLNNKLTGDVHIFNALILAAPDVHDKYDERWNLITELLNQMNQQSIRPNLQTFNSILKALRNCGYLSRIYAPQALTEMKALGIVPSLATYNHILGVFKKPGSSGISSIDILQDLMSELEGCSFTCRDPDDVLFFSNAMRICLDNKDLDLGYKVHSLVEVGENCRLLGNSYKQSIYYGCFFSLLCLMEHIDVVLKWYKQMIPSLYYPNFLGLRDLLQALDTDNRLDLLPMIWKDVKLFSHDKLDLEKELLRLMAREKHSPEVQESFAACALDIKSVLEGRAHMQWTSSSLSDVTTLLLRANKWEQAWEMLQFFKAKNGVPSNALLNRFLSVCQSRGASQRAVELVQLSAAFCLPATPSLATRVLAEFDLTEKQRSVLSELEAAENLSD
uniref:Small ribosomal subunit protein mS39 n=2 Tax=Kryptolebias marmoratus TaxID=37003 RepID=A0A3Q3F8K6_KRYMA